MPHFEVSPVLIGKVRADYCFSINNCLEGHNDPFSFSKIKYPLPISLRHSPIKAAPTSSHNPSPRLPASTPECPAALTSDWSSDLEEVKMPGDSSTAGPYVSPYPGLSPVIVDEFPPPPGGGALPAGWRSSLPPSPCLQPPQIASPKRPVLTGFGAGNAPGNPDRRHFALHRNIETDKNTDKTDEISRKWQSEAILTSVE